jgi:P pilus assembly chaperone PapD
MHKTLQVCLFLGLLLCAVFFPLPVHAGVGVNPTSISFGSVVVGAASPAATVVVTNTDRETISISQISSNLAEFIVVAPAMPITLTRNGRASFQVMFQPAAALSYRGSIVLRESHRGGGSQTISVSGTGTAAPSAPSPTYLLLASASTLNFGNALVGTSASAVVTMTNTGTGSVNISQVTITGTGFTLSGFSGAVALAAGQTYALTVSFAPTVAGSVTGSLSVVSSATNSPATISLSGIGTQPQISVIPASESFGNVTVGVTNTQTVTISNPGTANLSLTQALLNGTGFTLSGLALPLSVAPGSFSAFTVGFTPPSASSFSGTLTLVNNTPNSSLIVSLAGTGIAPVFQLTASPSSLSFGSVTTGTSATQGVTLTNTGNSSVSLSQISISGAGFSDTGAGLPLTLSPGQSTSFSVIFAPTATGTLSGSVTVTSNASNSPLAIPLTGLGAAPASYSVTLSWTPSSSSFEGFNVYRGSVSGGPYAKVNSALVSTASYSDTSVAAGQTYYYVVTEVNSAGVESSYSSPVGATIP